MDTTDGKIKLISEVITSDLGIDISVLMGANIAIDVARGDFCESTIGSRSEEQGAVLRSLFNRPTFHVNVVWDVATVELCGALKVDAVYVGVVRSGIVYDYYYAYRLVVILVMMLLLSDRI